MKMNGPPLGTRSKQDQTRRPQVLVGFQHGSGNDRISVSPFSFAVKYQLKSNSGSLWLAKGLKTTKTKMDVSYRKKNRCEEKMMKESNACFH